MAPDRVVVVLDPVVTLTPQPFHVGPWACVDKLLLVSGEEGFGDGIVIANPGPSQRTTYSVCLTVAVKLRRGILGATI